MARGRKWISIVVDACQRNYEGIAWTSPLTIRATDLSQLLPVHVSHFGLAVSFLVLMFQQMSGRTILHYAAHQQANPELSVCSAPRLNLYGARCTRQILTTLAPSLTFH